MPESATDAVRRAVTRWDNQTTLLGADVMLATLECGHRLELGRGAQVASLTHGLPDTMGCPLCDEEAEHMAAAGP